MTEASSSPHSAKAPSALSVGRLPLAAALALWACWATIALLSPPAAERIAEATPVAPTLGFAALGVLLVEIGLRILSRLRVRPGGPLSRWLFGFLLGGTILSFGCFALAALQQLRPVVLLAGVIIVAGWLLVGAHARCNVGSPLAQVRADVGRSSAVTRGLIVMLGLFAAMGLLGSLAPTVDNDSLLYHLGAPAIYLNHGGLVYVPTNMWTNIPLFAEMVYAVGLGLMGQTLARLFVFAWYAGGVACAYELCRMHLSRRHAILGAAVLASTPLLAILTSTAVNDVALVAYELAAVCALCNFLRSGRGGWLVAATILGGSAASVKYHGWLIVFLVIALGIARLVRREGPRGALRWAPTCALLGLGLPAMWLLKNFLYTGNPFHPMFIHVFGSTTWNGELFDRYQTHMLSFGLRAEGWLGLAKASVLATLDNERFGSAVGIGPLFLVLSPLALVAAKGASRTWWLLGLLSGALYLFWGVTFQALRYLLPALAVWALVLAGAAGRLQWRWPSLIRLAELAALVGVMLNWAWFVRMQDQRFRPYTGLLGAARRREYVAKRVPYYHAVEYANQRLSGSDRLLFIGEWRTFYTRVPFAADTGPDPTLICKYVESSASVEGILRRLRADGFTHVLYNPEGLDLLEREFGYLRFSSPEKRLLYSRFKASLELLSIRDGVSVYAIPQPRVLSHGTGSQRTGDKAVPPAESPGEGGSQLQSVRFDQQRSAGVPLGRQRAAALAAAPLSGMWPRVLVSSSDRGRDPGLLPA